MAVLPKFLSYRGSRGRLPRPPYAWLPYFIIALMIASLITGGIVFKYVETRLVDAAGHNLTLAAIEIAHRLDRLLFERHGDLQMMARAFSLHMHDTRELSAYLVWTKQAYSPLYLWLGVADRDGHFIAATEPALIGRDLSRTEWYRAVQAAGKVHFGDVGPDQEASGVDAVALSAPMFGVSGEFVGAVTARVGIPMLEVILTQTIRAFESQQGVPSKIEYQFITQEGNVFIDSDLAHKGKVNLKRAGLLSARLAGSEKPGYVEEEHLHRHVPVVTGYARTKGFGEYSGLRWAVLIRKDKDDILAPARELLTKLGIATAAVWVPLMGVLLWAARRLRREWKRIQESERKFVELARESPDAIIALDPLGHFQYFNPAAERLSGYASHEIIGKQLAKAGLLTGASLSKVLDELALILAGEERPPLELQIICRDRRQVIGEAYPRLMREHGRITGVQITIRDMTDRKQAEQRLRVQHATTRVLAEAITLKEAAPGLLRAICEPWAWDLGILWIVDRQANLLRCVDSWASPKLHGSSFEAESRQRTFARCEGLPGRVWATAASAWIADIVHETDFPLVPMAAQTGLHGASAFPITLGGQVHGVLEMFSREVRQPDEHMLALLGAIGSQIGHLIERRQLEERLLQSQKMEAIGRLAGGIAHDFNNLLTVIQGYSQLALNRVATGNALRDDLNEIRTAGERAAALTGQLLAFSRRQVVHPKVVDLNAAVRNLEKMLMRVIGEDINLSVALHPDLGLVHIDPGQLEQVVLNLAVNGRDAMPKGGKMTIETDNVDVQDVSSRALIGLKPGSYVKLSVQDSGCGMDEYTQAHVFEPFFTTKEQGKGTGLGLSMVYGIVKQAGGEAVIDSEPGEGTTVAVYLPRVSDAAIDWPEPVEEPRGGADGHETLLLVEDEPAIRALAREILERHGYKVLEARHGFEALMISARHFDPIHLLITDIVMPQMSGSELAERIVLERPAIKVLYISGYTDDAILHHGAAGAAIFLQKPFTPDRLVAKVREMLDMVRKGL